MGRALVDAIKAAKPDLDEVHFRPKFGKVHGGGHEIAKMAPKSKNVVAENIFGNNAIVAEFGLDKSQLIAATLASLESPGERVEWSL